jgi:acetylornithine deacetylase/succinyl-diaminopimelate desuccinylase-like protein
MGFTLPDARIHAPDERLYLPTLWRAVDTVVRFLLGYGTPEGHQQTPPVVLH